MEKKAEEVKARSAWGGRREGAGRKRIAVKNVYISVSMPPSLKECLVKLAEEKGSMPSRIARKILERYFEK